MKKIVIFCTILFYNYSFSQYKFILKGTVEDLTEKKIYLEIRDDYSSNEYVKVDSCSIEHGLFQFSGELNKRSEIANLFFFNNGDVRFDPDKFRFVLDSGVNVINIVIPTRGSKSSFSNTNRPASNSNDLYNKQNVLYQNYFEKYATDVKTYDEKKPDEITMVKMLNNSKIAVELRKRQLDLLRNYPNSFYSLIFLYESLHYTPYIKSPSGLKEIFKNLNKTIQNDSLGVEFNSLCQDILKAEEKTKINNQVPIFKIQTDKKETFTNTSILGKPYVLAFSATWCAPCKIIEAKLKLYYNIYKNNGLEVVYFNFDGDNKKWKEHISKNQLNWINVSDGLKPGISPISKQFNIQMIPYYIVVDKKGNMIYNSDTFKDNDFLMLEKYIKRAIE